jgi:arylsulfatase A-like enzyme
MKKAGFFTAGISANGWIANRWGFGLGWDYFHNHIEDEDSGVLGEMVWADAKNAIDKHAQDPFFLYMGMVDTHVPWRIHEPWFSKYDPAPYDGQFKTMMDDDEEDAVIAGKLGITDREKTRVQAFYDSDVSYQDDLIGKVRDQLIAWGDGADTMLVLVADHGDELWENGLLGHGGSLHEALVHVPMAILYPPLFPPGVRVDEGVDAVDLLPTLEDAVGVSQPADQQGQSLIPLAQGVGRGYPRPSFTSMYEDSHAMRIGDFKIVETSSGGIHVYDEVNDRLEREDLATTRPLETRFLTDAMSLFLLHQRDWKKSKWGVASNHSAQLAADLDH